MQDHNRCMHDTLREIQTGAQHYSGYLSALCSYLRGRSYLDQEAALRGSRATAAQLSRGHRRAIQKCCALVRGGAAPWARQWRRAWGRSPRPLTRR